MTDEIRVEPVVAATPSAKPQPQAIDKMAARRAELKRHKRKAHRRRINASNRPG